MGLTKGLTKELTKKSVMNTLPEIIEDKLEKILRLVFFWEKDDKRIGTLIRFFHHSIIYSCAIIYIMLHIFVPSYFIFLLYYCFMGLMWVHHIIIGDCIFSRIENRLIGDKNSIWDPFLYIFNISITPESTGGFFLLASSSTMFVLTCELIGKTIAIIKRFISNA